MKPLRVAAGLGAVSALLVTILSVPANAAPGKPSAIVSLGDSYISGEGGRWMGNSNDFTTSRSGTDRAYQGYLNYEPRAVYGNSYDNGCDRSDVAEIFSNDISVDRKINLACSGAQTTNLLLPASGGQEFKGERTQIDQLSDVARSHDVKMIVVSIGGNDLDFGPLLTECITGYLTSSAWNPTLCAQSGQQTFNNRMPGVRERLGHIVDDIRTVMANQGQAADSYRVVLQSGPSVLPRASESRYPQEGLSRTSTGGCPFWNQDMNWFRDSGIAQFALMVRDVAKTKGVDFLDLKDLLQGREVCASASTLVDMSNPPDPRRSEWARFVVTGTAQGAQIESLHPNFYGQQAAGTCLGLIYGRGRGSSVACVNRPGGAPQDVYLSN